MCLILAFTLLLVNAVLTLPSNSRSYVDKRAVTSAGTSLFELFNQLQLTNLDDLYAAHPEYLDLLIQLSNAANQIPSAVSSSQLNSSEQQALQVVLNIINGNSDIITAVDHLVQLIEESLESNPQLLGVIQSLAQQIVDAALVLSPK